jgi:hypothetical protein
MHRLAMIHAQSLGIVVYLDVEDSDILRRLERMKVDRIVGQNDGKIHYSASVSARIWYARAYFVICGTRVVRAHRVDFV